MEERPACPDYRQGSSLIWPLACADWTGGVWCKLPGRTCAHKAYWSPPLTGLEQQLIKTQYRDPLEACDD